MKNRLFTISIVGLLIIGGFLGLFIATNQVSAPGPTYVSGPIAFDTTWYLVDTPYIVTGDVTVEAGATLTIEAGVEVRFDGVYSITVDGKLIADGTSVGKIKFTSNQSTPAKGDWYNIRLRSDDNLIDHTEVEYATYGVFLTFFGSNNTVSNTTVKYCKYDGIYITNSDDNNISNCTSTFNDRFGITIYESHRTNVNNCTIQNNNFFGIHLNASTHTQIYDTNISYNDGKGILFYSNSYNTTISGCQIDWNNHIGIDLWGTSDNDIINTTIIGNNGIGIDFHEVTKNQWIDNCTIRDNEGTGIDLRGSNSVDIVGCDVSRNKGYGGIYSANPVYSINITKTKVLNNSAGNGIDFNEAKWVNITHSDISGNMGNGIYFNASVNQSNNTIHNCSIAGNSANGVYFLAVNLSGKSFIQNNNIYSNMIHSNNQTGVYFFIPSTNNNYYSYIQYNNIYLNTIYSNNQNGIYLSTEKNSLSYIQNNNIYSNTIYSNNRNGIYFFCHNTRFHYIQNNNIFNNSIYSNGKNGISFDTSKNPGLSFYYFEYNHIFSNLIYSNNQNGICLIAYSSIETYIQNNRIYSNTIFQHTGGKSSFGNALDNNALYWTTYGDAEWVVDTSTYYYDGDSAKSGNISHNQETYLETQVIGPGMLTFYWKISSASNDYLAFSIDGGSWIDAINGEVDWHQKIYDISSGLHILKWVYVKYETSTGGSDCGWLDKIEFTGYNVASGILLSADNPAITWEKSHIYNNTFTSNLYGIALLNIKSQAIYTNNISSNNEGILLMQSSSNSLRYNDITYNNRTGINLTHSSNNNIIENNNIISNNITGIFITDDSNNNQITRNNITHNSKVGMSITDASGNQVHHNNFINNTQNSYDSTIALNDWDDGSEGNYWFDYLGTDDDGDGFGEDPYIISGGGSRDWHPFIELVDITAPYIISTLPVNGEVNVPVDTTITITFSKEMNITAVEGAISISGALIPTDFIWDVKNETVTFIPSSNLDSRTTYTVTISTDAKDAQGNRIKITYVFSFTAEDIEAPMIIITSPFDSEINVELNVDVVVTFNEPMQPSSVTYTCAPDPFGWSVSWNDNNTVATFSHNNFGNKATYTFHIASGKDIAGLDLVSGSVPNPWSFTSKDLQGPEIISTSPGDSSQNVSTTANIVVSFNEEMDLATVTYTCSPDLLSWSVIWSNNNKTATFSHDNFTERTVYTFHITGAKDISSNDLNPGAIPNPWSFITTGDYVGPQITMTSPADSETNVDLDWNVTVTFNEPMDISSVNFVCIPDPGGWFEIWGNGDTVVTYSHNPFENGTSYTLNINMAKDVPGNDLISGTVANPWSFITKGDIFAPQITSTSPANNEVNVDLDKDIMVVFSEVINTTSLNYTCTPDPGGWSEIWSNGNTFATLLHNPFTIETFYTFQITIAKDISGSNLAPGPVPNPWSFTAIGDVQPPQIISTSPVDDEVDVDLDANIIVTFSETMDTSLINYICIPNPGGWSEIWSTGDTVVTYSHNPFSIGTFYNFYIIAAEDIFGNDLSPGTVPNPWSFTTLGDTIEPQISSISPAHNEINVGLDTRIIVTFTEAMDTSSIDYTCSPDPDGWFEGWSDGNTVITLLHNPFALGTTYSFQINAGKDLAGNNLTLGTVPHSWNFTTVNVNSIIVTPSKVNISVEGTVVLIAQAYDLLNNPITDISYIWSINNNLGIISPQGSQIATFKASSYVGICYVNVTAGGKSASAIITIKSEEMGKDESEDLIWISFLWLVIIIACIVIVVVILWKRGSEAEEYKEQIDEDTTSEEMPEVNQEKIKESETSLPPEPLSDEEKPPPDD